MLHGHFAEYVRHPELLPARHLRRWGGEPPSRPPASVVNSGEPRDPLERVVGDYLAGMTDRFAQQEHLRLFHPSVD